MRALPFELEERLPLAVSALVPFVLVAGLEIPLKDIVMHLLKLVLWERRGGYANSIRMGWRVRVNGLSTNPRISRVTTPSRASSPGSPRMTGVCPSP